MCAIVVHDEWIYSAGWDGNICIWDTTRVTRRGDVTAARAIIAHRDRVSALVMDPSRRFLVSCGHDARCCVYSLENVAARYVCV